MTQFQSLQKYPITQKSPGNRNLKQLVSWYTGQFLRELNACSLICHTNELPLNHAPIYTHIVQTHILHWCCLLSHFKVFVEWMIKITQNYTKHSSQTKLIKRFPIIYSVHIKHSYTLQSNTLKSYISSSIQWKKNCEWTHMPYRT